GGSVSKNPYLAFSYAGKAGDKIKLAWTDNKGETDSAETDVA
ncbi:MAG: thiosulfate oxidation carrier complex protein SoxZ, partial [Thiothrix litoralis]